jgi:hypothetical protein
MTNPTSGWDEVPLYIFLFKNPTTPDSGGVRFSVEQRVQRADGRQVFPGGVVYERTIGDHAADTATRDAVRASWRAADEAAQGVAFDGAAWDAWWNIQLSGSVFVRFPASDDPDILQQGYQVTVKEELASGKGKTYVVQPTLAMLSSTPPGLNLGTIEVPPGTPFNPAPIYAKNVAGGVVGLDEDALIPLEFLPEGVGGDVAAADITDATTTGRNVLKAVDAAAARNAIGASSTNAADLTGTLAAARIANGSLALAKLDTDVATQAELDNVAANRTTTTQAAAAAPVQSVAGRTGAVSLAKADVGLGSVDNVSAASLRDRSTHTGTDSLDATTDSASRLAMTAAERSKLAAVASNATANSTDAQLRDRISHTGTQTSSTIADFAEAVQDVVGAVFAGGNVTATYTDNGAGTGTISLAAPAGTTFDPEATRDAIGAALLGAGLITVTINDAGDTITVSTTATANSTDAQLRDPTHTGVTPPAGLGANPDSLALGAFDFVNGLGNWMRRETVWLPEQAALPTPVADRLALLSVDVAGVSSLVLVDQDGTAINPLRDTLLVVRNETGATIPRGALVYQAGVTTSSYGLPALRLPTVALARADVATTSPALGVTTTAIANNSVGRVMIQGMLSGLDTSAFAQNDRLYLSKTTAGAFVVGKPDMPCVEQRVALVVRAASGTGGQLFIDMKTAKAKGLAGGDAGLDAAAVVPAAQLPVASTTARGAARFATAAEAAAGTALDLALNPAALGAATGRAITVVKLADSAAVNNTTTMVVDPDLLFAVKAGERWQCDVTVICSLPGGAATNTATDLAAAWTLPAGTTGWWQTDRVGWVQVNAAGAASGTLSTIDQTVTAALQGVTQAATLRANFLVGADGVMQFRWGQNTATAIDLKVLAGSNIVARKLYP